MSQCVVPSWNLRQQRQGLDQQANEGSNNKSSNHVDFDSHHHQHQHQNHHFHNLDNFSQIVPMSNTEVTELTWENGQLAMHELGGIFGPSSTTSSPPKAAWAGGAGRANDTLESIVHQATHCNKQGMNLMPAHGGPQQTGENMKRVGSVVASSGGKQTENSGPMQTHGPPPPPVLVKKRTRPEVEQCGRNKLGITNMGNDHESTGASANAEFCRADNDTTIVTWNSFESPMSCTKTKITTDEDSACHGGSDNQEEERETKGETGRSYPTRKGRAAAVHNQSERRRRERINQKMKALQKLVPNANKTDKASMLDEVIEYLKHLQAQVQMMSNARFMPQVMMPFGMQQHLQQMSLLARMGMGAGLGMGIGMLDATNTNQTIPQSIHQLLHSTQASSAFVSPAFVVPQMIPTAQQSNPDSGAPTSSTMQDPYSALLAQSMNTELYNRIATLQRQQQQAQTQSVSNQMQFSGNVQGG